jgi:Cu-Zn family superoxide dismutase
MRYQTIAAALLLAACSKAGQEPADNQAEAKAPGPAQLKTADGGDAGMVTLSEDGKGVTVKVEVAGLQPGPHGLHLHAVGRCDGPKFESAGPHWNPLGKQHGKDNPQGAHLGDLANLEVGADGRGAATFTLTGQSLLGGEHPLLDLDGAALVVHAKADDYKTDPSGASGDRVACAVLGG